MIGDIDLSGYDWHDLQSLKDRCQREIEELSNREKVKVFVLGCDAWDDYFYDPLNAYSALKDFWDKDSRDDWINSGEGTLLWIKSEYVEPAFAKKQCKDEPTTIGQ